MHAFPLSRAMWADQRAEFSKHFQFISIDLPGFGESPFMGEVAGMDMMAQQVMATIDHLQLKEKCVITGLSMGGYVMLQALKQAPDRFRAAAFISTRPAPDSPEAKEKRFKNVEFVQSSGAAAFADRMAQALLGKTSFDTRPAVVANAIKIMASADPAGICAALRGMAQRGDTSDVLDSLRIPALFIAGKEDFVIPAADMEAMSKRVGKSEFHALDGVGHLLNLEQPLVFNDLFAHFLKRRVL